jgi:hypothetical protein
MNSKDPTGGWVPIGFCAEEGERILIYKDMQTWSAVMYLGESE